MSFVRIEKISPEIVTPAENGFIYLGYDDRGVWAKDGPVVMWISSGTTSGATSEWNRVVNDIYYSSGKVAVGTSTFSTESLTVNGAINIGDATVSAPQGSIKYASGDFYGKKAAGWVSLTNSGSSSATGGTYVDLYWSPVSPNGASNLQSPIYINSGTYSPNANDGVLNVIGKSVLGTNILDSVYIGTNVMLDGSTNKNFNLIVTGLTLSSGFASMDASGNVSIGITGDYAVRDLAGATIHIAGGLIVSITT